MGEPDKGVLLVRHLFYSGVKVWGSCRGDRTMAVKILDRYMWNHLGDGHV